MKQIFAETSTISLLPRQLELLVKLGAVSGIETPSPADLLFGAALGSRGLAQIGSNGRMEITEKGAIELRNRLSPSLPLHELDR